MYISQRRKSIIVKMSTPNEIIPNQISKFFPLLNQPLHRLMKRRIWNLFRRVGIDNNIDWNVEDYHAEQNMHHQRYLKFWNCQTCADLQLCISCRAVKLEVTSWIATYQNNRNILVSALWHYIRSSLIFSQTRLWIEIMRNVLCPKGLQAQGKEFKENWRRLWFNKCRHYLNSYF